MGQKAAAGEAPRKWLCGSGGGEVEEGLGGSARRKVRGGKRKWRYILVNLPAGITKTKISGIIPVLMDGQQRG